MARKTIKGKHILALSMFLGVLWGIEGIYKILTIDLTSIQFANYSLISMQFATYLVVAVGISEFMLGVCFARYGRRSAVPYVVMIMLLSAFSALGAYDYLIGNTHSCGCGLLGFDSMQVGPSTVLRNLVLTVLGYLGFRMLP